VPSNVDLLPSDTTGVSHLEAAEASLNLLRGQLQDATRRSAVLKEELAAAEPMMVSEFDAGGPAGNAQLAEAEQHLRELQLKYTEQHPDVIAAKQRLEALKAAGTAVSSPGKGRGGWRATARCPTRSTSS